MKSLKAISSVFLIAGMLFTAGCSKQSAGIENTGATINGTVSYNNDGSPSTAPNALVWLTYGATSASNEQDMKTFSDINGAYTFQNLKQGNYFISATYTDSHGFVYNSGGCAVKINSTASATGANILLQ